MLKSNIALVGMMGTGKSTVGVALASRLGWTFVDSDSEIERVEESKISEMFATSGEAYFREVESRVLNEILNGEKQIVATGGGAVLADANRKVMKENSLVIALTAPAEVIIDRVKQDRTRPLLQGNLEERVHTIMEARKHAYDFADVQFDTSQYTIDELVDVILQHAAGHVL